MTVIELRKRLIGKINATENSKLLEDMYRLITNEKIANSIYKLSKDNCLNQSVISL